MWIRLIDGADTGRIMEVPYGVGMNLVTQKQAIRLDEDQAVPPIVKADDGPPKDKALQDAPENKADAPAPAKATKQKRRKRRR